ncbi:MAG TPA: proton-conducting transporter membrane subunit [Candidatus Acidoferrum sp.]|nr:proton-conducting transporter membrane subunit [Candidatus Acidoferrum sp.]
MSLSQAILVFVVLAPGLVFAVLASLWLLGWTFSERVLTFITFLTFLGSTLGVASLTWTVLASPSHSAVEVTFGSWFGVGDYHFPLVLLADRLSMPFLALAAVLSGLIGQFSATYLHRERGFLRFFLLLHLFAFGSLLAFAAGSFDLLAAGWEIVGITSVLLIGFFQLRPSPVENGLRVFGIYRASDIGLLVGVFALHHWAGTASFVRGFPSLTGSQTVLITLLLLLAAAGKAAQIPFSGWLPRAMEGPTPSSAIFYGAISIHAGAYLLLRAEPLFARSVLASGLVILIGAATAIHSTVVGRASADAKTSLSYATLTQVGIVFIETGFGWKWLAVAHILGNATVRTMQYLRAPSMLHDFHQMHSAIGSEVSQPGRQMEDFLPERVQLWLYRWAFDRGHLDTILDRWVIVPLLQISRFLARSDGFGMSSTVPRPRKVTPISLQRSAGEGGD